MAERRAAKTKADALAISLDRVDRAVHLIRGERVILDEDLAALYGAETRAVVQAVKRNADRFPDDFMFQLSASEWAGLKAWKAEQAGAAPKGRGGRRTRPYAFTEHGVAMLSSVLSTPRAVAVNIEIMRAFAKLRGLAAEHEQLARKLAALEKKYDHSFKVVFAAIRQLMDPPARGKKAKARPRIGFVSEEAPTR